MQVYSEAKRRPPDQFFQVLFGSKPVQMTGRSLSTDKREFPQ